MFRFDVNVRKPLGGDVVVTLRDRDGGHTPLRSQKRLASFAELTAAAARAVDEGVADDVRGVISAAVGVVGAVGTFFRRVFAHAELPGSASSSGDVGGRTGTGTGSA